MLKGISLEVDENVFVAVVGPNGSGKTTFIRCVLGILACEGKVEILGRDPRRDVGVKRAVGYLPQQLSFPPLSVREVVELHARLVGVGTNADAVLKEVGLLGRSTVKAHRLSGGERQRLGWAMALLHGPKVLFLDEPFSNLDVEWKRWALERLVELKGRSTVFLITHELELVKGIVDNVVEFEYGEVKRVW
ncbi:ABC transporter ATP-binding protein [Pyrobaculum sp.]|uniref:ABC transporter ATP-binding protein n=1 Tax=Pyrobaculum sp. TaxID=2004705 RepID=UPI00316352CD